MVFDFLFAYSKILNARNPRFRCAKIPVRIEFPLFPQEHHGEGIAYVNFKVSRIAPYCIFAEQTYKYKIETNNKIVGILVVFASQYCHFEEREIALEIQQLCVNLACDLLRLFAIARVLFLEMTNDMLNI
ncbi:hypothetical protein IW18_21900 [Flavobacterium hibernum]|uniref:Uncharacterized protein n=1 Tax=Flavobacterium hibernum TaxID=37752 RepID=A0A0D0EIZ1_9FLAO|nr:hypothetical protein IW18_21900 [Flavobacterium hibernum]OXA87477.1 hypothetical protein B0A73_11160 [Flavobacterium hibernum]